LIKHEKKAATSLLPLAVLQSVRSKEVFGLVKSRQIKTFGGLIKINDDETNLELEPHLPLCDNIDVDRILKDLGIDPALQFEPLSIASNSTSNCSNPSTSSVALVSTASCIQEVSHTGSFRC
jgi:hypothetical protein